MKAIIIDDEKQSLLALKQLLNINHPEIDILAFGENVGEGYQLIKQYHPEVVFLDIELPDGLGFDLLRQIDRPHFHVVFITAHNKYAITAIKFGALDYLLKPISEEELTTAVQKIQKQVQKKITEDQLQILLETLERLERKRLPSRIAISTSKGIVYREVKSIVRLQADQNFTHFYFWDQTKRIIASLNIGMYIEQFAEYKEFMQVHRSHLVNLRFVDTFIKADGGYLLMKNKDQVSVSRAYRDELLERLSRL